MPRRISTGLTARNRCSGFSIFKSPEDIAKLSGLAGDSAATGQVDHNRVERYMRCRRPGNLDWENFWPFDSGVMFGFCVYLRGPVLKGPFVDTLGFGVLASG